MKKLFLFIFALNIVLFLAMAATVYSEYINTGKQLPIATYAGTTPKDSPSDIIKEEQIIVTEDEITINIQNAEWSKFADTHSMEPVLSSTSNGIEIVPKCENIKVGDIIVYDANWARSFIVHRVKSINSDEQGLYFTMKGDNNPVSDPEQVRCSQIKYQLIGILY